MKKSTAMQGKRVVVTGATDGIGRVTARRLAGLGAEVLLVGRNKEKAEKVVADIRQKTGNADVDFLIADLSSQNEIRILAHEIQQRFSSIDVLINNAGALFMIRQLSVDGIEMTFALNHLSYYLLTRLLMDQILAAPRARVINVSSVAHQGVSLDFDDLQLDQDYDGWQAYKRSKLCNLYFTYALARRLRETSVTVNALHPGFVRTRFGNNNEGMAKMMLSVAKNIVAISPEKGARTSVFLAAAPQVEGVTGEYFVKSRSTKSSRVSRHADATERLWAVSATMTGLAP